MNRKNDKLELLLLLILIIGLGAGLYFYFYNSMITSQYSSVVTSSEPRVNTEYEKQKTIIMPILSSFKKYGDWPQIPYQLSQSRGNPFQEKPQDNTKDNK
ncbi:MAG: hypothetical protein WC244_04240 [Patescibacteria group bacterium]|jgi:hypothetical protein